MCTCIWDLKTMPVNNEDARLWTQNLGKNWLYLRPYLKAFAVFNVLKTCREHFLTIYLGIVEFLKKFIERFLEKCEIFSMEQITSKNCIKSIWMQVNKILLTRDRQEQLPYFFVSVFNGINPLWDEAAFPKRVILANCAASMLFHCFYDS